MSQSDTPSTFKETFSPNASDCILCFKLLGKPDKDVTRNPAPQGLTSIFAAGELKDDIVHKRLGVYKEDTISVKLKVAYHRSCRATYTSKSHRKTKLHDPVECVEEDASPASKRLKRELNLASAVERSSVARDEEWKLLRSHTDSINMQQISSMDRIQFLCLPNSVTSCHSDEQDSIPLSPKLSYQLPQ